MGHATELYSFGKVEVSEKLLIAKRPGDDYPTRVKSFRASLGLTQQALADRLSLSFATVNRWENGQTRPSQLSWNQLRQLEKDLSEVALSEDHEAHRPAEKSSDFLDFTACPKIVKVLTEGERGDVSEEISRVHCRYRI